MIEVALLIGLATYRLWRLAALDTITEPVRAKIFDLCPNRFLEWVLELIACVWCLGWWIAGALTFAWYGLSPEAILVWPAASAVAGLVARLATIAHAVDGTESGQSG